MIPRCIVSLSCDIAHYQLELKTTCWCQMSFRKEHIKRNHLCSSIFVWSHIKKTTASCDFDYILINCKGRIKIHPVKNK